MEEVAVKLQNGEAIDLDDYEHRYPEHASQLRQLLPMLEAILFLQWGPGRERGTERGLREVGGEVEWGRQRGMWPQVCRRLG
jgi:hypothetical protein